MKPKKDTKFGQESTCCFKIGIRNLTNFNLSTQKSQRVSLKRAPFEQSMYCLSYKSIVEVSFMTLRSYANFEEKLTSGLKKDMRNLANFYQST